MSWLKKKPDPLSERARSLNNDIAALEAQIKRLDAQLHRDTTHPRLRGRGLSRAACARLCQSLMHHGVEHIGLSVKTDNASAIACYTRLGFEKIVEHGAYMLEWKR